MAEVQSTASTSRVMTAPSVSTERAGPSSSNSAVTPDRELVQTESKSAPEQIPQSSQIENPEWGLKEIIWPPERWEDRPQYRVRIVTQNANGPCSFIAICNILLLRGAIKISPPNRPSASYEYLSSLVGDYLVNTALDLDIASVFSILPKTQYGMDLNPLFTGISSFRPAGEGGELKLFDLAAIQLVHGWLVDPDSQEFGALSKTEDYDTSLDAMVAADAAATGQENGSTLSEEDQEKVLHAMLIRQWLEGNPTQLTYYGLFALNDSHELKPNELICLFRGSHLSVLYKRLDPVTKNTMLYTLVTDRVFLREPSIVWESLVDVDGQSSSFYDSFMAPSTPAGGDVAGQTAEQIARSYERREEESNMSLDFKLARQLQLEEDRTAYEQEQRRLAEERDGQGARVPGSTLAGRHPGMESNAAKKQKKKDKDKGDCIIM